jgi:hypothetical protein
MVASVSAGMVASAPLGVPALLFVTVVMLDVPLFVLLGGKIFHTWDEFKSIVGCPMRLDFNSWFGEEALQEVWGELRLALFVLTCLTILAAEYLLLTTLYAG